VQDSDIPPGKLTLEITETMAMSPSAHHVLRDLQAMGLRLSIDDFGTGYSSLAYLRSLPVAEIKIDRSFVMDLATREDDAAIVRSTIDLGHNLDLEVVAEGVSDHHGYEMLFEYGCDYGQGHYLSKPLAADEVASWKLPKEVVPKPRLVGKTG
jgi:EAL domain-containing protein (putative c-di-GMP-specific phosphodiesterase class I)